MFAVSLSRCQAARYGSLARLTEGIVIMQHEFLIRQDDLSGAETRALLALHLAGMRAHSPQDNVFALDVSALQASEVTVWSVWCGDRISGIGALRQFDATGGEVKSMRTHPAFLRQGVGRMVLDRIIAVARQRGLRRLSLETGSGVAFEAAVAFYRQAGFQEGSAFSEYRPNAFSRFFHLIL